MALSEPLIAADAIASAPRQVRVCHIMSADLWAGAEVQVATVASYLVQRPEVELVAVLFNEGPLARELRRLGVDVTIVDEHRNSSVRIVTALVRLLQSRPVDIVHTHRYKDTVLGVLAAKLAHVPCVVRTVHGRSEPMEGWEWLKFTAYDALDKAVLRRFADRLIAVSGGVADSLESAGCKPHSIVRLPNGIDLQKVRPARSRAAIRRDLGVAPDAPLIGTVGRLSPVKGHAHLLGAAMLILDKEPDARFLVVGDGPLRATLDATATRLRIDHACRFVGSRTDVYDLVAAMDMFVLPSLDEGTPMALLEAMALATPVIATAVGGVPEILRHGAAGVLVDPGDERALADACLAVARNREWARTLGIRARCEVEQRFSHEKHGEALVNLYQDVAAGSTSTAARGWEISPPRPTAPHLTARLLAQGLLAHGARRLWNRIQRARERRHMEGLRRNPRRLVAALRAAKTILIVCHGNIIRSPFAARVFSQALGKETPIEVFSAGLAATPGKPSPEMAILAAAAAGIDLRAHRATAVTRELVAASDLILVMDLVQMCLMRSRFPEARERTFLLASLAPGAPLEVRDPVDGNAAVFRACFNHIDTSVRPMVGMLGGKVGEQLQSL